MNKLINFVKQPWFLSLLLVLTLCLLIWYVGPLVSIAEYKPLTSDWVRLIILFALFVFWGLNNLKVHTQALESEKNISEAILAPDKTKSKPVRQPISPDEQALSSNLQEAVQLLQGKGLGKNKKLYSLPWYMIIGTPGSGKTTALKNSGLHFPLQGKHGQNAIQGEGGTRHCDWWFTEEAILIDTAGRYTSQDTPKNTEAHAWRGFLARLKKARPKQPLNGIIVTVSIQDILQKTATQKSLQATAIKRRIQELNNHLEMKIPVYLVLSKLDMVAGFNSFFADLEPEDREQIWGFTYNLTPGNENLSLDARFEQEFDRLIDQLETRVLLRLNHEHSPQKRALIYEFPRQMRALKNELRHFVTPIFTPNQFENPILWRGTYLCSSTQSNMASQWVTGILPAEQCAPPIDIVGVQPKTFFVKNLLRNAIFSEANIATLNDRVRNRFRWMYVGSLTAGFAVFSGMVFAWSHSKALNSEYIATVEAEAALFEEKHKAHSHLGRNWFELVEKLNILRELPTGYEQDPKDHSLQQGFGLYQGDKLGAQAAITYKKSLEALFMKELSTLLVEQIELAHHEDERLYEALKFYLMLYHAEKMDRDSFTLWVNILWERELPRKEHSILIQELNKHLDTALNEQVSPYPINSDAVETARNTLIKTPIDLRVYRRLKNDYMDIHPEQITVKNMLGKKADVLFYRQSGEPLDTGIPELFTYSGFHRGFNIENVKLSQRLADEQWIYGDGQAEELTPERIDEISQRVNEYYFNEYKARWDAYLNDIAIQSFGTVNRGQSVVQLLAGSDQPLVNLLTQIRKHTALSEAPALSKATKQTADQLAEEFASSQKGRLERLIPKSLGSDSIKLPGADVTEYFEDLNHYISTEEGLPLHQLQQSLIALDDYFQNLAFASNSKQAAFDASKEWNSASSPVANVQRAISEAPSYVATWFSSITRDTVHVTAAATQTHMNNVWQTEVVSFYEKAIKDRYPLNPKSRRDVKIADFAKFFGPNGLMDNYFTNYIEPFVDTTKSPWRWKKNIGLSRQSLALFQQSQNIKHAYFSDKNGEPEVTFSLKPHTLDHIASGFLLETAGTTVTYNHGPVRNFNITWPGEKTDLSKVVFSLSSKGTPVSARTEGEWSWFRLLDQHSQLKKQSDSDGLLVTFEIDGLASTHILQPSRTENPYFNRDITAFSLPASL